MKGSIASIVLMTVVAAACGGGDNEDATVATSVIPTPGLPVTYTGPDGVTSTVTDASRIVALSGEFTEIVFALGLGDNLVGVDLSSVYPLEEVKSIPKIGVEFRLLAEPIIAQEPTVVIGDEDAIPKDVIEQVRAAEIPVVRRPAKWVLARLAEYLAETQIPDLNSGMRVFRKDLALSYFNILPSAFSFTITITIAFLSDHYLVKFVPIPYRRREGRSKIRPMQDTMSFIQLILRTIMYFNPLKVLLPISFGLLLAAVVIGAYSLATQGRIMDITVITLTMAALQIAVVAMIADMIQKKSKV